MGQGKWGFWTVVDKPRWALLVILDFGEIGDLRRGEDPIRVIASGSSSQQHSILGALSVLSESIETTASLSCDNKCFSPCLYLGVHYIYKYKKLCNHIKTFR